MFISKRNFKLVDRVTLPPSGGKLIVMKTSSGGSCG